MQWWSQAVQIFLSLGTLLALCGSVRASCCCLSSAKSYAAQGNLPNRPLLKYCSHEDNTKAIHKVTGVKL